MNIIAFEGINARGEGVYNVEVPKDGESGHLIDATTTRCRQDGLDLAAAVPAHLSHLKNAIPLSTPRHSSIADNSVFLYVPVHHARPTEDHLRLTLTWRDGTRAIKECNCVVSTPYFTPTVRVVDQRVWKVLAGTVEVVFVLEVDTIVPIHCVVHARELRTEERGPVHVQDFTVKYFETATKPATLWRDFEITRDHKYVQGMIKMAHNDNILCGDTVLVELEPEVVFL